MVVRDCAFIRKLSCYNGLCSNMSKTWDHIKVSCIFLITSNVACTVCLNTGFTAENYCYHHYYCNLRFTHALRCSYGDIAVCRLEHWDPFFPPRYPFFVSHRLTVQIFTVSTHRDLCVCSVCVYFMCDSSDRLICKRTRTPVVSLIFFCFSLLIPVGA